MKKHLLTLVFIAFYAFCYSQEVIELKFNPETKKFCPETQSMQFKSGVTYKVKITGLNTSVIDYKISAKAYSLNSPTPEMVKPLFLSIAEGFTIDIAKGMKDLEVTRNKDVVNTRKDVVNDIYTEAITKYDKLSQLKVESDRLYEQTKSTINVERARNSLEKAKEIFNVETANELMREVSLYVKYIICAQEIYMKMLEFNPTDLVINNFNSLSIIVDDLKSTNYLSYVDFIVNSLKAKDYIEYNPFKAEKDVVDLNLTFVDSYKKDTLYNSTLPFYTRGNISFDFSSGFFFNNLREGSYYLEKRDSSRNNVLIENTSAYDISIGALGHLSYKAFNWAKFGVSMGAALSPFDGKMRYLVGLSAIFGRRNELAINGGYAFAKMKVLSNSVKNDAQGNYVPIAITAVPTYEKVEKGFFVGLTYNLSSTKK